MEINPLVVFVFLVVSLIMVIGLWLLVRERILIKAYCSLSEEDLQIEYDNACYQLSVYEFESIHSLDSLWSDMNDNVDMIKKAADKKGLVLKEPKLV